MQGAVKSRPFALDRFFLVSGQPRPKIRHLSALRARGSRLDERGRGSGELGSADDFVLKRAVEFDEIGAVTRYADDQAAELGRVDLSFTQRLGRNYIELHMRNVQPAEPAQKRREIA